MTKIFINMASKDLPKGTAFYEALGFVKNPQFSSESASGLSYQDEIYVMLHTQEGIKQYIGNKDVSDAKKVTEVLNSFDFPSKEAVDAFMEKALAAGAHEFREKYDLGFMYGRAFEDLDGHIWEPFWMDVSKMPATPAAA